MLPESVPPAGGGEPDPWQGCRELSSLGSLQEVAAEGAIGFRPANNLTALALSSQGRTALLLSDTRELDAVKVGGRGGGAGEREREREREVVANDGCGAVVTASFYGNGFRNKYISTYSCFECLNAQDVLFTTHVLHQAVPFCLDALRACQTADRCLSSAS